MKKTLANKVLGAALALVILAGILLIPANAAPTLEELMEQAKNADAAIMVVSERTDITLAEFVIGIDREFYELVLMDTDYNIIENINDGSLLGWDHEVYEKALEQGELFVYLIDRGLKEVGRVKCIDLVELGMRKRPMEDFIDDTDIIISTFDEAKLDDFRLVVGYTDDGYADIFLTDAQGAIIETNMGYGSLGLYAMESPGDLGLGYETVKKGVDQGYLTVLLMVMGPRGVYEVAEFANVPVREVEYTSAMAAAAPLFSVKLMAAEPAPTVKGDVNGDGNINAKDIISLARYLVGYEEEIDTAAADVNEDGKLNNRDVMAIMLEIVNG